jgi:putative Mg2+ transporter-C (MgtC) family protein
MVLATFVGAIIGLERELRGKAAGIRTFAILCLSACLLTLMSLYAPGEHDTSRIVGQIISGIGFLAGAVIWKKDSTIEGLTTAASMFCVTAIGVAIGYGFEYVSIFATALVFIVMEVFGVIVKIALRGKRKGLTTISNSHIKIEVTNNITNENGDEIE